ncbi:hypothetical protein [Pontibacter oryzae]|uniref:Uncharacterized protein n=1 Tax=Pontibacter oryzae TaxID=2304593 RepID=A0A399RNT6_9BACT|nr:hypothetical protein [Pontibacter oryzae]RIJ33470.1 hypothetical protein D1627_17815 [Pontibacter oryzae]
MANYLITFMLVLLMSQCRDTQTTEPMPQSNSGKFGQVFTLEQGQEITLTNDKESLNLGISKLVDSRCPEDVSCIWQGNATLTLEASNASESKKQLTLCIGDCRPDPVREEHTIRATIGGKAYSITLQNVTPYPNTQEQITANAVTLLVEPAE